jgi:hypothetical protein
MIDGLVIRSPELTPETLIWISHQLRPEDRLEIERAGYATPLVCLKLSIKASEKWWMATMNGCVMAVWGVVFCDALSSIGYPWLFTTKQVDRHKRLFLLASPHIVREMLETCGELRVSVDAEYDKAVRWLTWLGFDLRGPSPHPRTGAPFYEGTMERTWA